MADDKKNKGGVETATSPDIHDQDECVFEVVYPKGVLENGRFVPQGELIMLRRGHALAQNTTESETYRLVKTVRHVHGPSLSYEGVAYDGPKRIS
ncbi:MAG: hypothetical protein GXP29_01690 [Planctomycetes bacterium]|nr:hypothetical protein [Planctomycetota bacterium]